ncbi:MAG: HNH endonuclease family protein [Micropepsaceae bacterium]
MSEREKQASLNALLSLIVRRAVCGLTNKNYNNLFLSVISELDKKGWSYSNLRAHILATATASGRFPQDEEFQEAILSKPLYNTLGPARVRTILSEIEIAKRGNKQEDKSLPATLTVEHVLPQTWRTHWPITDEPRPTEADFSQAAYAVLEDETGLGRIVRRNRLRHALGNLTLVTQSFNSAVSNLAFDVKRKELEEQSILMLNKGFTKLNTWNEDAITERGRNLFGYMRELWAIPKPLE